MFRNWIFAAAGLGLAFAAQVARAEHPALASYREGEARRQALISQQLDLNCRMSWMRGFGPTWADPFEPWPFVAGDIWGYPSAPPVEHPVGHISDRVAPDRWIYRPVYAADVAAGRSGIAPRTIKRVGPETEPKKASEKLIVPPRPSQLDDAERHSGEQPRRQSGPRAF